jgi:hypothetical protein
MWLFLLSCYLIRLGKPFFACFDTCGTLEIIFSCFSCDFFLSFFLFDLPWDDVASFFRAFWRLWYNLNISFHAFCAVFQDLKLFFLLSWKLFYCLEHTWASFWDFNQGISNKIKPEKDEKYLKSDEKLGDLAWTRKSYLYKYPPSRTVMNLYSTWMLSWTYLDSSQVVQVDRNIRKNRNVPFFTNEPLGSQRTKKYKMV